MERRRYRRDREREIMTQQERGRATERVRETGRVGGRKRGKRMLLRS